MVACCWRSLPCPCPRCRRVFHFEHPPLHDPTAVAYVIAPHLFKASDAVMNR